MKISKMKPLPIVLVIMILTCIMLPLFNVLAADFEGGDKQLIVEIEYERPVSGIGVSIYRVATVSVKNGKLIYTRVQGFVDAVDDVDWPEEMNLTTPEYIKLRDALVKYATTPANSENIEKLTKNTGADGIVTFDDLKNGLYLIVQANPGSTRYKFVPALVAIGAEGVVAHVFPKVEYERERPRPTPTPTPGVLTPTPTPGVLTPTPTPGGSTPTPTTIIDDDDVPTTDFPGEDGDKPGKIPITGVVNLEIIIIILTVIGILFLVVGLVQKRRRNNEE